MRTSRQRWISSLSGMPGVLRGWRRAGLHLHNSVSFRVTAVSLQQEQRAERKQVFFPSFSSLFLVLTSSSPFHSTLDPQPWIMCVTNLRKKISGIELLNWPSSLDKQTSSGSLFVQGRGSRFWFWRIHNMFLKSGDSWLLCIWLSDLLRLPQQAPHVSFAASFLSLGTARRPIGHPLVPFSFPTLPQVTQTDSSVEACPSKVRALSAAFLMVFWGTVLWLLLEITEGRMLGENMN